MTLKPAVWFPIAAAISAINLAAVWFAAAPGEPMHATAHAVTAVGFGIWAQRLRQRLGQHVLEEDLDAVELESERLRHELNEAQARLDIAERLLAQGPEARPADGERWKPKPRADTS